MSFPFITDIQFRKGTLEQAKTNNKVLKSAEPGYVTDVKGLKIGDGTTPFNDLDWFHTEPEGWVNVKKYGAVGDGITDDTEAIQSAIDSLSDGDTLYFPKSTYLISNSILIENKNFNKFISDKALLKFINDGYKQIFINNSNFIDFDNFKLTKNETGDYKTDEETIFINLSSFININNNYIYDIVSRFAITSQKSENINIKNNYINNYSYGGVVVLNGGKNIKIFNNVITNSLNTTVDLHYPISASLRDGVITPDISENIDIYNNYIDNDDLENTWVGIDSHGGTNINVYDNTIKNSYSGITLINTDDTYKLNKSSIYNNKIILPDSSPYTRSIINWGIIAYNDTNVYSNYIENGGQIATGTDKGGIKCARITYHQVYNNTLKNTNYKGIAYYFYSDYAKVYNNLINDFSSDTIENEGDILSFNDGSYYFIDFIDNKIICEDDGIIRTGDGILTLTSDSYVRYINNITTINKYANGRYTTVTPDSYTPDARGYKAGKVGDIVYNDLSVSTNFIGWVCTVAGDPLNDTAGTWNTFGVITP